MDTEEKREKIANKNLYGLFNDIFSEVNYFNLKEPTEVVRPNERIIGKVTSVTIKRLWNYIVILQEMVTYAYAITGSKERRLTVFHHLMMLKRVMWLGICEELSIITKGNLRITAGWNIAVKKDEKVLNFSNYFFSLFQSKVLGTKVRKGYFFVPDSCEHGDRYICGLPILCILMLEFEQDIITEYKDYTETEFPEYERSSYLSVYSVLHVRALYIAQRCFRTFARQYARYDFQNKRIKIVVWDKDQTLCIVRSLPLALKHHIDIAVEGQINRYIEEKEDYIVSLLDKPVDYNQIVSVFDIVMS